MKTLLYRSGIVFLGIIGLWVIINLFDESPDSSLPLQPSANSAFENAQDNGFFALVGIGEPLGRSAAERHAAGMARYKGEVAREALFWQKTRVFSNDGESRTDLPGPAKPALTVALRNDSLCDWQHAACLEQFHKLRDKVIKEALRKHQVLHERYRELYAYSTLATPMPDDVAFIMQPSPFDSLKQGSALVHATAGLAALDGHGEQALSLLAEDIGFQRRMLSASRSISQTNVAAMNIARNLSLMDEIIARDPALRTAAKPVIAGAVQTLAGDARDLEPALRGQFIGLMHMIDNIGKGVHWQTAAVFSRPFFRRNAYTNAEWARSQALIRMLKQTPADRIHDAFADWQRQNTFPTSGIWPAARNPIGTYLAQVSLPSSAGFLLTLHDLDAYQRMLAMKFGELSMDATTPTQGFHSKPITRSADGLRLSVKPTPDSRWPKRLTSVMLSNK